MVDLCFFSLNLRNRAFCIVLNKMRFLLCCSSKCKRHVSYKCFLCGTLRLLPESVVWLYANGRVAEAEQIIRNAAKLNSITMPDKILVRPEIAVTVDSHETGKKSLSKSFRKSEKTKDGSARYTILDIFRNRHLTINIFCTSFTWSVKSFSNGTNVLHIKPIF